MNILIFISQVQLFFVCLILLVIFITIVKSLSIVNITNYKFSSQGNERKMPMVSFLVKLVQAFIGY